jgi:ubiquinol-cytochrome c reductase cytochrome b subunit
MLLRKAKQVWNFLDDRIGFTETFGPMITHAVPRSARWWYVFGSATLFAFILQVISGVALAFSYVPSTGQAFESLQFITNEATLGRFMRALHYYGASAMVLMVGLHMVQVYLFGAYKYPREMTWVTGVLMLGFTLIMGFTGQLLRWDQTGVWSVIVAAEQVGRVPLIGNWLARLTLGGDMVGGATLGRFFAIHVFVMPALVFAFVGLHLLGVLRHGISSPPRPDQLSTRGTYRQEYNELLRKEGVPFWPDSAWRDVVFAAAMTAVIVLLAIVFGPPELGKPPDPSIIEAYPRPDWYLLWYFALLALLPKGTEDLFMILGPILVGLLLIALPFISRRGERSPRRRPWAVAIVILTVIMVSTLWNAGARSNWSPNFQIQPLPAQVVGTDSGPVHEGARLFYSKGCLNCHLIGKHGGRRGPNLTDAGSRLSREQLILITLGGRGNMPAYANNMTPAEMEAVLAFLESRKPTRGRVVRDTN